jgi:alkylation response protein AidB-like acyl-CoA dehydrogenase
VLASGARAHEIYDLAHDERMVLTAAALVGMTEPALAIAVEFSKTRETMGVPIATLQGVAFPMTDVAIGIAGARNIARKAAWYLDHAPDERPELPAIAMVYASQTATHGTQACAHVQGGLGFTVEADASLYFLRSKGWGALAGDPQAKLVAIGDNVLNSVK